MFEKLVTNIDLVKWDIFGGFQNLFVTRYAHNSTWNEPITIQIDGITIWAGQEIAPFITKW